MLDRSLDLIRSPFILLSFFRWNSKYIYTHIKDTRRGRKRKREKKFDTRHVLKSQGQSRWIWEAL